MKLLLYLSLMSLGGSSGIVSIKMKKVMSLNIALLSRSITFANSGRFPCASECLKRNQWCFSFSYNKETKMCTLGDWVVRSGTPRGKNELLFTTGAFCNTSSPLNFGVHRYMSMSACIWQSTALLNYYKARSDCEGKGANLYATKPMEKLYIFLLIMDGYNFHWVGLDDIKEDSVFRWLDDGSILEAALISKLFSPGFPTNSNGKQDCVCYNIYQFTDCNCAGEFRYVCEMSQEGNWV